MVRVRNVRGGQATAIGSVLFFMIAVILVGFLYDVYMVQAEMIQFDASRNQERFGIREAVFGAFNSYTKNATYPENTTILTGTTSGNVFNPGVVSAPTTGINYPSANMNFTDASSGWSFSRSYYGTGSASVGAAGFYSLDTAGSPSGPGLIYSDFTFNPPPGKDAGAVMNWTTRFYINMSKLGTVTKTFLSIGKKCTTFFAVSGSKAYLSVYLNSTPVYTETISKTDIGWSQISVDISSPPTSFTWSSGWYNLVLTIDASLSRSGTGPPEFKMYFDDVGLQVQTSSYVADWSALFYIYSTKTTTRSFDFDLTTRYDASTPVEQYVYIKDVTRNGWVLLGVATIFAFPSTISYSITGTAVQNYISDQRTIEIRIYATLPNNFTGTADKLTLVALSVGVGGQNQIVVTFENTGGVEVSIVSLWIIDSIGHTRISINLLISPTSTQTYVANYAWSSGKYTFKVVSSRGNIAILMASP